ncbi:gem-associated protein 8 [Orussus abietinus]|uniref:gem-associated protein 8 n=1 Tax=Orussus abietinus TaxID=222816 RepID=UPI000626492E|nr:gem-associated protein 8 [Orussus abietinus]
METVSGRKHRRNCRRKRKSKQGEQVKLEVRLKKQREFKLHSSLLWKKVTARMDASTFWANYTVAQEWQQRHSVVWWRTRCIALEHENQLLRDKIRSLVRRQHSEVPEQYKEENTEEKNDDRDIESSLEEENLEFHVDEDMMSFLEQSLRHKMELKQQRDKESLKEEEDLKFEGGAAWDRERSECAKLLYGEASPRILAMETALQATIDRHKDKAKPQYWPNIPLKP